MTPILSMEGLCRSCNQTKKICASRVRACNWICNQCATKERDRDPAHYLRRKLAESLRFKGVKAPYPGISFIRQVIAKCNGKSAISNVSDLRKLCIVLLNQENPVPEKAFLLTTAEARAWTRKNTLQDFPDLALPPTE
jgi:hypothetical protein